MPVSYEDWKKIGNTWSHDIKVPKTVGLGFINSWGRKAVTLIVDSFSLEGEGVKPMTVEVKGKLTTTWGAMKKGM